MSTPAATSLLANATLFELSPEHVEISDRVGFLHEGKAAALGRLMAVFGQRDPIKVVANPKNPEKPWRLVTGRHRLVGAIIESIAIYAIEVKGTPEHLRDMEASENLHRRPLAPIERAMFVHSLATAAQEQIAREHGELKQQQLAIRMRWARVKAGEITTQAAISEEADDTVDKMSSVCGWRDDAAEQLGLGKKEIQRALTLYRLLIEPFPDFVEPLSKHPVVGENAKQLRDIAEIKDEAKRRQVIELVLGDRELSADDAKVRCGIGLLGAANAATPVQHQKFYNQIEGGWSRLNVTQRREFLPKIAAMLDTPGLKRDLRDRLNAELGEAEPSGPKPAVAIRASVKPGYIVCLEDGTRHINLTMRLNKLCMTPAEYRERWNLPGDYPMLAPDYRLQREKAWRQRVRARRLGLKRPEVSHAG